MLATIDSASDFDPSDYVAGQRLSQGLATIIHAKAKTKPRPPIWKLGPFCVAFVAAGPAWGLLPAAQGSQRRAWQE